MTRYLLDTSFIVDHLRGEPAAIARLRALVEKGDVPYVNDVVTAEAWAGAPEGDDPDLTALLRFVEFIQAGPEHARSAGRWRVEARLRGRTLSLADALIGASADDSHAIVLTRNVRDFELMPISFETY